MRDKIDEILKLIKKNNFIEAEKKCKDIKNKLDNNLQFFHIYGFVSFNLKDYDKAIELWKKTIKIDPNFVSGLNNIGNAFSKLQKFEEAIRYLNKSLEIKPDFFETHYTLSEIFFQKELHEKSLHHLNEAIKIKPDHLQSIKKKLKLLLKLNKKEETLKFLEKIR